MRVPPAVAPALLASTCVLFGWFAEQERREVGRPIDLAVLDLLAGYVFVAAGVVVYLWRPRNRCWWLLMGAGGTWFISTLAGSSDENLGLFGFAFGGWHYFFLAWLLLAYPSGRIVSRRGRVLLAVIVAVLVLRTLWRLFLYVPPDLTGCHCERNRFLQLTDPQWFDLVEGLYPWVITVLLLLVMAETLLRWRQSSGAGRRMLMPVAALGAAAVLQIAYAQVIRQELEMAVLSVNDLFVLVVVVRSFAAVAIVMGLRRTGATRSAVVEMVGDLNESTDPDTLGTALRHALQDPSLVLVPWSGAAPEALPGRAVTLIKGDAGPLAALVHDEALLEDPGLVSAISAAVRLTVDNERLRSELQQRLDDLAASRERIIAAGDEERRRIERDLHDGTQQRLVTIALQLRLAEARYPAEGDPETHRVLTGAVADLATAVDEVRDLARGIHPAILTEAGLQAALESLADRSPVPVRTRLDIRVEPSSAVAATAYFTVSEALTNVAKHAEATEVLVEAWNADHKVHMTVSDDGRGGAVTGSGLAGLADRVSAVGGTLSVVSPAGGGTTIEVMLPCA